MPIRETFWNIPHWAEIGQYLLGALTILIFAYGVTRRVRRWRMGQMDRRTDRLGSRLLAVVVHGVGQLRTAREAFPGVMHLAIFWGMIALLMGTILATIDWDVTHLLFNFQFLTGGIYILYELILDIFGILLLVGLGMAIYRRYVLRPDRLKDFPTRNVGWDDAYALVMLILIALSGYIVEGLRIAVIDPEWRVWSPVGNVLAGVFSGLLEPTNRSLHLALWAGHTLIAFAFIASIPFTKLFHILAAPVNIFFQSFKPVGQLAPARSHSGPGVETWRHFTWKQILDFEACVRCGRCQDVCPAYLSHVEWSPRNLMVKLDAHIWEANGGKSLHGDIVSPEEIWGCTTCRACSQICPIFADHLASIIDLRRHLVYEGQMDMMLQEALSNVARYGNSFGQSERMRTKWTQGLGVKVKDARKNPVKYLWFVGDYASYNASLLETTRKTAEIFDHAGLDFGILYDSERNAGNDIRRVGEEGLFEMLAEKNAAILSKCDFEVIVTTDPHTYNTLKNEYPEELIDQHPVMHYTELLDQLIASGQIIFNNKLDYTVTYHDPCYLGRYNGVYEAPRRVIAATGSKLIEMPRHGDLALCCGAGGGRIWMEEGEVKQRPSEARIEEAAALEQVQIFAVACPKDITMYNDAVKTAGYEGRLVVKDLVELVYDAL